MHEEVEVEGSDLCDGIVDASVRLWSSVLLRSAFGGAGTSLSQCSEVSEYDNFANVYCKQLLFSSDDKFVFCILWFLLLI